MDNKVKLRLMLCFVLFIQGCIPLAYTFKKAVPSKITARGIASAHYELDEPSELRRLTENEARQNAVYNLIRKIEKLYATPYRKIESIIERNPQAKLKLFNLVNQARIKRQRFLGQNKVMIELEIDGKKIKELLAPYY